MSTRTERRMAGFVAGTLLLAGCDAAGRELTEPNGGRLRLEQAAQLAVSNTWATKRSTPTARMAAQAGTIDSFIYLVGGVVASVASRKVEFYNVLSNTWASGTPLPSARLVLNGASVINRRLYVAGGLNTLGAPTKTLYVYDPDLLVWTRRADMPVGGCCGVQGVIGGELYVYTPRTSGATGDRFFRYNPESNTWVTRASPPSRHISPAAGVIAGKFYLAGGTLGGDTANLALHVYNPATNSWTSRARLPMGVARMASTVIGNKLLVAGGINFGITMDTLRVYDPAVNRWTKKKAMPTERSDMPGALANGRFFVIGGITSTGDTTKTVEAYTP